MELQPIPRHTTSRAADYTVSPDFHAVTQLAKRLPDTLASTPPGAYVLADVAAFVAVADTGRLTNALRYLGHRVELTDDAPSVTLLDADTVESNDLRVLHRARERCPLEVTVRQLRRLAQWRGVNSWSLRGCVDRLEASGDLRRHPGCRRTVTTMWQVTAATPWPPADL